MFMFFLFFEGSNMRLFAYLEPSTASAMVYAPVLSWTYVWKRDTVAVDAWGAIYAIWDLREFSIFLLKTFCDVSDMIAIIIAYLRELAVTVAMHLDHRS